MNELNEILRSNQNLEQYLKTYGTNREFLYHYYLQDVNRILVNYYAYSKFLSFNDKLSLIYRYVGQVDISIIDSLVADVLVMETDSNKEDINKLLSYLLKLDKKNIINANYLIAKNRIYSLDPVYAINKDMKNITSINCVSDTGNLLELLEYLKNYNYEFTNSNYLLITDSIIINREAFIYFLNNCKYNDSIEKIINNYISKLSNRELVYLYNIINNSSIKEEILKKTNFNNFNTSTVVNDEIIYLKTDNKEEKTLDFLKQVKFCKINSVIVLIMNRVNLYFINKAYKLYPKIRVSPIANQEEKRFYDSIWNMPYYTINEIKKSEKVIDLYVSCVLDKKSKTGEIKSLSPLEKFIAAYIMTIKFSPYKSERMLKSYHKSRAIYEFVDKSTNKKIVCVGYVHLLREFLYRMGIKDTIDWEVHIPEEYECFDDTINHLRMIIHLKDSKYNIDGVYMSDPTWDEKGLMLTRFNHMLMSLDELTDIDSELSKANLNVDKLDTLSRELKVKNIDKLFNKPITKDMIIRAYLALEHFLDVNMEMVNDNNYTKEEYEEAKHKLGWKWSMTK